MADFAETSISRNAKRVYATPINSIDTFESVVQAFRDDTTMNITKVESSSTYKARIDYMDAAGDNMGYILFYGTSKEQLADCTSLFTGTEAAETVAGVGGSASVDSEQDYWSVKFNCSKNITVGNKIHEDSFTIAINKEYVLINGFAYDETLEAVETWADTQDAMA